MTLERDVRAGRLRGGAPRGNGSSLRGSGGPRAPRGERAVLAGRTALERRSGEELTELRLLAETAGAQVAGEVIQRRGSIRSATFLSR